MPITLLPDGFERRHVFFETDADPDYRESLAFLMPLPQHGIGIIYYTFVHSLGADGRGKAGAMMVVYGPALDEPIFAVEDGILVPDEMDFSDWEVGPARMTLADDMMSGRLRFAANGIDLDVTFDGLNPSFGFLANRNGCPAWLATDRTEQGVHYRGRLEVTGRSYAIDDFGHRDHSWGNRDWGGPTHWKWWNIMAPGGIAIHAMELQAFGTTTLHGYVQKDGVIGTILSMTPTMEYDDRFMHVVVSATIEDDEGRTTQVEARYGADLVWPVSAFLTLHEASMFATVDGIDGVGYLEMAWPPAYADHHRRTEASDRRAALTINGA